MQDLPFEPSTILNPQQIAITRFYCINDLDETIELFEKLEKEIKLRTEMSAEYGIDLRSKSDAQIAEAVIAKELTQLLGRKPRRAKVEPGRIYKYNVPKYMKFESSTMKWVLDRIKNASFVVSEKGNVGMPEDLANFKVEIAGSYYKMGIGGLHSCEKTISHYSTDKSSLHDHDVASYYPWIILNQRLYPNHLGPSFLKVYRKIVERRLKAKHSGDKSTADSLKIVINGSFGKLGNQYSVLYAPDLLVQVTISGQLSLLMLIEQMEMNGIPVVSANTDGIVVNCPKEKLVTRNMIIQRWEQQTRFDTDETSYSSLHSRDVNNYIAIKVPNKKGEIEVKTKGAYSKAGLSKNPTNEICIDALREFLLNDVPIETTIQGCTNFKKFLTVRNVKGGAVPVHKIPYDEEASFDEVKEILNRNGWKEYYGSWVRQAWIDDAKPYDRMALPTEGAYKACQPVNYGMYLGKAIRWYYSVQERGMGEIVYAGSGNKVPRSEGAKAAMDMPVGLPIDIDYQWYIDETNSILEAIGCGLSQAA
jgi:hypothetical protein